VTWDRAYNNIQLDTRLNLIDASQSRETASFHLREQPAAQFVWSWSISATACPTLDLVLKFVAPHCHTDVGAASMAKRCMPVDVVQILQGRGLLQGRQATCDAHVATAHIDMVHGLTWSDRTRPFDDPRRKKLRRLAGRSRIARRGRHSKKAITRNNLTQDQVDLR